MHHLKSYVLRAGRMSNLQKRAYESFLPKWGIPFQRDPLELRVLFPNKTKIIMEIGFGMGVATAEIAEAQRENGFLCTEVFSPGIGRLLNEIERRGLDNVRVVQHDAFDVLYYMIPDGGLDGLHIFFPDPWPKRKHHKRRLIQDAFLGCASRKLKPGGYLYMVTDWDDYAGGILKTVEGSPDLENPSGGFTEPLPWRPKTRFEEKAYEKQHPVYEIMCYKKKS